MNADIKARWVAALRGGQYSQVRGRLRKPEGYCCLGVLCDLVRPAGWGSICGEIDSHDGGYYMCDKLLPPGKGGLLTNMNDDGFSFAQIADFIEENL